MPDPTESLWLADVRRWSGGTVELRDQDGQLVSGTHAAALLADVDRIRAEAVHTGGDQVVVAYHRRFDNGHEVAPTDVELTIGGHRYVVTDPGTTERMVEALNVSADATRRIREADEEGR